MVKLTLKLLAKNLQPISLLSRKKPDVVLALGRRSLTSIEKADSKAPIVLGAISNQQKSLSWNFYGSRPQDDLGKIGMLLSPSVGRIHVVKKSQRHRSTVRRR